MSTKGKVLLSDYLYRFTIFKIGRPVSFYEEEGHELGSVHLFPPGYRFADGYSELLGNFAEKHSGLL